MSPTAFSSSNSTQSFLVSNLFSGADFSEHNQTKEVRRAECAVKNTHSRTPNYCTTTVQKLCGVDNMMLPHCSNSEACALPFIVNCFHSQHTPNYQQCRKGCVGLMMSYSSGPASETYGPHSHVAYRCPLTSAVEETVVSEAPTVRSSRLILLPSCCHITASSSDTTIVVGVSVRNMFQPRGPR